MVDTPHPMADLFALLEQIDGQGYGNYQRLCCCRSQPFLVKNVFCSNP